MALTLTKDMKLKGAILLGALVVVIAFSLLHKTYPSATIRYKMTIVVDTPEGYKTGSAVREIHLKAQAHRADVLHAYTTEAHGEAIVVDLGVRGQLYAVMRDNDDQDYAADVLFRAFPHDMEYDPSAMVMYYQNLKGATTELAPNDYPLMLVFRNPKDLRSAKPVLVMESDGGRVPIYSIKTNRFQDYFGQNVKLHSVSLQTTTEPVTGGIVEKFLPDYKTIALPFVNAANFKQ